MNKINKKLIVLIITLALILSTVGIAVSKNFTAQAATVAFDLVTNPAVDEASQPTKLVQLGTTHKINDIPSVGNSIYIPGYGNITIPNSAKEISYTEYILVKDIPVGLAIEENAKALTLGVTTNISIKEHSGTILPDDSVDGDGSYEAGTYGIRFFKITAKDKNDDDVPVNDKLMVTPTGKSYYKLHIDPSNACDRLDPNLNFAVLMKGEIEIPEGGGQITIPPGSDTKITIPSTGYSGSIKYTEYIIPDNYNDPYLTINDAENIVLTKPVDEVSVYNISTRVDGTNSEYNSGTYSVRFVDFDDNRYFSDRLIMERIQPKNTTATIKLTEPNPAEPAGASQNTDLNMVFVPKTSYDEYVFKDLVVDFTANNYFEGENKITVPRENFYIHYDNDGSITQTSKVNFEYPAKYNIYYSPNHEYEESGEHFKIEYAGPLEADRLNYYLFDGIFAEKIEDSENGVCPNRFVYDKSNKDYLSYVLDDIKCKNGNQSSYIQEELIINGKHYTRDVDEDLKLDDKGYYKITYAPGHEFAHNVYSRVEYIDSIVEESNYEIYTIYDYISFVEKSKVDGFTRGMTVTLQNDLDFTDIEFIPISVFNGTFLGNGHTLKNVTVKGTGSYSGIFRHISEEGKVSRLNVNAEIELKDSQKFLGGIAGSNSGTIEECSFSGSITGKNSIGGICGRNELIQNDSTKKIYGKIINCKNNGSITGYGNIGGICGYNCGEIIDSENTGVINCKDYPTTKESTVMSVGGICGFDNGIKIIHCKNRGSVGYNKIGSFIGGITGMSVGNITECVNYGNIIGRANVGGICGYNASFTSKTERDYVQNELEQLLFINFGIESSSNAGETHTPELLQKETSSKINYCHNEGTINGENIVGGIVGYMNQGTNLTTTVNACYNSALIKGNQNAIGGVIGNYMSGDFSECFNTGEVRAEEGKGVGGIAGTSQGEIKDCYAVCDVIGSHHVGGIVGEGLHVSTCYSNANIIASGECVGAIAGNLTGRATFNYYIFSTVDGIDNVGYIRKATRLTYEDLSSKNGELSSKVTGFDTDIWEGGNGKLHYPQLKIFANCKDEVINQDIETEILEKSNSSTILSYKILFLNEDGDQISCIHIYYDESAEKEIIPKVPEKEGYYGEWADYKVKNLTKDQRIKPVYVKALSSLANSDKRTPEILITGVFHPDTILEAEKIPFDKSVTYNGYTVFEQYRLNATLHGEPVNLTGSTIKVHVPNSVKKPCIGVLIGKGCDIHNGEMVGSYLKYDYVSNDFLVLYKRSTIDDGTKNIAIISAAIGAVLALCIVGIGKLIKRKKIKKIKEKNHSNE